MLTVFKEIKDKLENNCREQKTIKSSYLIFFLSETSETEWYSNQIKNSVDDFYTSKERISELEDRPEEVFLMQQGH